MDQIQSIKAQLDMQSRWFNNVLADVNNEESQVRGGDQVNHMKWIAGHLLNTRLTSISRIAGLPVDESYKDSFARGAVPDTNTTYPSIDELLNKWNSISPQISAAIAGMPAEVWQSVSQAQLPIADNTVLGTLHFLISHEALHIGQLSLLRKLAGKGAMSFG